MNGYLLYDCEIIKCIPLPGFEDERLQEDGYFYCNGWTDFPNMGISVIGYYSSKNDSVAYSLAPFQDFFNLVKTHDCIIGFNSSNFDDNLCRANNISISTHYDVLDFVRLAAFGSADWKDTPRGFSYSLDALTKANGFEKTGSGGEAPKLWQRGEHQAVIDYCINDVYITHEILKLGLAGELIDPNTGRKLHLPPIEKIYNQFLINERQKSDATMKDYQKLEDLLMSASNLAYTIGHDDLSIALRKIANTLVLEDREHLSLIIEAIKNTPPIDRGV